MVWLLFLGATLIVLLFYYFNRKLNHFNRLGINQTNPYPIVGDQFKTFLTKQISISEWITYLYNLYPTARYMGFYDFMHPALLIRDPELIKDITVRQFEHFTDHRAFVDPDIDPLFSANLFSLHGDKWKTMRSTLSGSFTSSKMKHMFEVINETAERFSQYFWNQNEKLMEIELKGAYTKYANDVIATSAYGLKVDSLEDPTNIFYKMGATLTNFDSLKQRLKFVLFFVCPQILKAFKVQILDPMSVKYFNKIICDTIRLREDKGIVRNDMIHLLLQSRKGISNVKTTDVMETDGFATIKESTYLDKFKSKEFKLTDDDIVAQALIFFIAGFHTVSTSLSFGSYELALNKDVQDKLREEINKTCKENNGKLTYESLSGMKYLDMVYSEILRKWPPAPTIDRVCTKPYTIPPKQPNEREVKIKVGEQVVFPIHPLHRDPKYHPNPDEFDPERFSDENKHKIQQFTFNPFGYGPRSCIGSRFAILEAKTLLYHLLLNFEIVPIARTKVPLVLMKGSMHHTADGGFWLGLKRIDH